MPRVASSDSNPPADLDFAPDDSMDRPPTPDDPARDPDDSSYDSSERPPAPVGRYGSDWEVDSDSSEYEPSSEEEDVDYVSTTIDESIDDTSPLSVYLASGAPANAPGTPRFKWRKTANVPQLRGFTGAPGVKPEDLDSTSSVLDIFGKFFTPELWELMVEETNRYARQNPRKESKKMKAWVNTTVEELKRYVGVRMIQSIHSPPATDQCWSNNPYLESPVVKRQFTRDRFADLTRCLHFVNNDDCDPEDRLGKLGRVIRILGDACSSVYKPRKNVSIDESLWAYQGRHYARQYNPSKRARYGMKVYRLCASEGPAAGYTCAFRVYMGADRSDLPVSTKVVLDLLHEAAMLDQGYTVYLDNWYSSPTLYHMLQQRKTLAVGTVRPNRKWMPKDLKAKQRGDVDHRSTATGMMALQWKDKKVVTMLSTCNTPEMVELPPNRQGVVRIKPACVQQYNTYMGGVDTSDHLAQSYPTPRKTLKWYIKVFYNLLDLSVVNSFSVYKELGGRLAQLEFKLELLDGLIRGSSAPPTRRSSRSRSRTPLRAAASPPPSPGPSAGPSATSTPSRTPRRRTRAAVVTTDHRLVDIGRKGGRIVRRRCRQCREAKKVRKDTRYRCDSCEPVVPLCEPCFMDWHVSA